MNKSVSIHYNINNDLSCLAVIVSGVDLTLTDPQVITVKEE